MTRCMTPDCTRPAHSRGVCINCYAIAYGQIRIGKTTWEELETLGMVKGTLTRPLTPFAAALKKAKSSKGTS